jgi:hypothetical protein
VENGPFIDDLPIKDCDFPWPCQIARDRVSLENMNAVLLFNHGEDVLYSFYLQQGM